MWTVYAHINKANKKKYIGITSRSVEIRWKKGKGYSDKLPIGRAFVKYGWDNFYHVILFTNLSENMAKQIEKHLIMIWKTQDERYGYNITSGGDGTAGWHPSEETKKRISKSATNQKRFGNKNPNYGHKWSKEQRMVASQKHKRENLSKETLEKMSLAARNKTGDKNPFYGKHHSDETKQILSEIRKRAVLMYDINNNLIAEFDSIKGAAELTDVNKVGISNCCRGKTKTSGGYIWKYKENDL